MNNKKRPRFVSIMVLFVLFSGAGAVHVLNLTAPKKPAAKITERIWLIESQKVQLKDLSPELTLYGKVESPDLYKASAPKQSRVTVLNVREGNLVKKNEILLELDKQDFHPTITQNKAEISDLEAQIESEKIRYKSDLKSLEEQKNLLQLARAEVARNQRLGEHGSASSLDKAKQNLSQQELNLNTTQLNVANHETRLASLRSNLDRATARLQEAERDFKRSRVVAPFDGIVSKLDLTIGNQVRANEVMLELYSLDRLEIRTRIPTPYQNELMQALTDGHKFTAKSGDVLLELDRLAGSANTAGIDALFKVISGDHLLRLGQQRILILNRPAKRNVIALPYSALYGNDRVYRIREDRLNGVKVKQLGSISIDDEELMLISSDELKGDDRVLITHLPNAVEGLKVTISEESAK